MSDNPISIDTRDNTGTTRIVARFEFRYLAAGTLLGNYVLMLLGAYTSAIGAGLSCPDWPTCYGTWIPFLYPEIVAQSPYSALQIFAEWAHRSLAMIVGLLILLTAITAWKTQREHPAIVWSATLALAFLPVQVILGELTVTALLEPIIVTSHLGVATLIVLSLMTTTVATWLHAENEPPNSESGGETSPGRY